MLIASNAQIRDTLILLMQRPQKVINDTYDKLKKAESNGIPLETVFNQDDIFAFQKAIEAGTVFNLAMRNYNK